VPRAVYGYFPAQSSGNDLIVYQPDTGTERVRFTFPRQPAGKRLCLADYFASVESGRMDVVAFDLVTVVVGPASIQQELFKQDDYADYLYFTGSVWRAPKHWLNTGINTFVRNWALRTRTRSLKLFRQGYQGSRFSFWLSGLSQSGRPDKTFRADRSRAHRCRVERRIPARA